MKQPQEKILVALSGGVDSAVAVLELQKQGFEAVGVYFEMLSPKNTAVDDARNVAKQLGIELIEKNISQNFEDKILVNFVEEYKAGRTPNPCTLCNKEIKFKYLLRIADELGIKFVATGHYALIQKKNGFLFISKAKDVKKDQSYFLYKLNQIEIARIIFPLGNLEKNKVKEIAKEFGLKIPASESQDVCFLKSEGSLRDFLIPKIKKTKGNIFSEAGEFLGLHDGAAFYTIGQRRGINVNGGPFYVISKDATTNTITVTRDKNSEKLLPKKIIFKDTNWISGAPKEGAEYLVKTRYLAKEARAKIIKIEDDFYETQLIDSQWAVAPGQALVVFEGDLVKGGGVIVSVN